MAPNRPKYEVADASTAFASARTSALNATIKLAGTLSTILATADVLASQGNEPANELRATLMRGLHALHMLRHQLLAIETRVRAEGAVWS